MRSASDTTTTAPGTAGTTGRGGTLLKGVGLLVLAALVLAFPSMAPDPFILSVGVVIMSYAVLDEIEAKKWRPRVIVLGPGNKVVTERGI